MLHSGGFNSGSFEHCGSKLVHQTNKPITQTFSSPHFQNKSYFQKCYSSEGAMQGSYFICMSIRATNTTSQPCTSGLLSVFIHILTYNLLHSDD